MLQESEPGVTDIGWYIYLQGISIGECHCGPLEKSFHSGWLYIVKGGDIGTGPARPVVVVAVQ